MAARDGRLEADWWRTAQLLAQTHNLHRGKGQPVVGAERFNPFAKKVVAKARAATDEDLRILFGE